MSPNIFENKYQKQAIRGIFEKMHFCVFLCYWYSTCYKECESEFSQIPDVLTLKTGFAHFLRIGC